MDKPDFTEYIDCSLEGGKKIMSLKPSERKIQHGHINCALKIRFTNVFEKQQQKKIKVGGKKVAAALCIPQHLALHGT